MNKIQLRKYQDNTVQKIRKAFSEKNKHLIVQLPTGGGKTVIFSYITQNAIPKGNKVLILTDRTELLTQAGGTLNQFDINPYYIKAGAKIIDYRKNCFIAMSQTLRNRINKKEWSDWILNHIDIVIIDEAHIQEFNYLFESDLLNNKIVLGFTATPQRSGKMRQLGLDYEKIIRGPQVRELIELGYLVNCDIYDYCSPEMSKVSINSATNDYNYNSMAKAFDKPKLYAGLINNYEKYTPGQKMLVFCCNVEHAIKTTVQFAEKGYPVKFLSSKKGKPKPPAKDATKGRIERYKESLKAYHDYEENYTKYSGGRKSVIKWFNKTSNAILVNVDMLTKGFDEPSIEVVALNRATKSMTLYLQMIGRGSRILKGKSNFTLFDFGGNVQRLGSYESNREWSLWHEERKGSGGIPPLKECGITSKGKDIPGAGNVKKGCKRMIMASQMLCPFCGFKYPKRDEAKEIELKLASIKDKNGVSIKVKSFNEMSFYELKKYREIKQHKMAWLWRQLWIRGGEDELSKFAMFDNWSAGATQRALRFCKQKY
jgi:superfamily II DNA or RNA helicase